MVPRTDPAIRNAMRPDIPERIADILGQRMDRAQVLASRNVGWRVILGEIPVKLRHIRL
jgi:hypothetical protein